MMTLAEIKTADLNYQANREVQNAEADFAGQVKRMEDGRIHRMNELWVNMSDTFRDAYQATHKGKSTLSAYEQECSIWRATGGPVEW